MTKTENSLEYLQGQTDCLNELTRLLKRKAGQQDVKTIRIEELVDTFIKPKNMFLAGQVAGQIQKELKEFTETLKTKQP